jgi:tripartite-type tricarboxylate transporter receptor subunit TctC
MTASSNWRALTLATLLAACAAWMLPTAAVSQGSFPDRPIRLIVPQAPGSATDLLARSVAAEVEIFLNQKIIVENKPGAGFTIGLDIVAKAAPDGYTLGMGPVGALAISPNMVAKMPYDVLRDFQPIAQLTRGHLLLAVSPKSNIRSVQELIAEAKKNPGKLTNASSANGSPGHVGGELFKVMTGTQIVHVPYRGGPAAMNDLIAGHVQLMFESLNSIAPHAHTGAVRGLAVSGARRSPMFKDLPTIAEAGVPGYESEQWFGVMVPAATPRLVIDRLHRELLKVLQENRTKERFIADGGEVAWSRTPDDFSAMLRAEIVKWAKVVKAAGIKPE